jgi:hypothetical protein
LPDNADRAAETVKYDLALATCHPCTGMQLALP